jgi:hypothetical protein
MSFRFQATFLSQMRIQSDKHQEAVHFSPWNKPIEFRSMGALSKSRSVMIRSCGFPTKQDARVAANDLVQALLLAGAQNVHGVNDVQVKIVPDSAAVVLGGDVSVSEGQSADLFAKRLAHFAGKNRLTKHQRVAAELINDFSFQSSSDTRFILSIVAVETLCSPFGRKKFPKENDPTKKRDETNSEHCQRIIRKFLDTGTAARFAPLYKKRNDFVHEGKGKGALQNEAAKARQIATDLLLAQV